MNKNIYVLPTDKPSRLISSGKEFNLLDTLTIDKRCKHIYITSDEELKEGDWVLLSDGRVVKAQTVRKDSLWFNDGLETIPKYCKKIILTTDQDLIKDGVQAINNDFLEWFVKNPTCEKVEVINEQYTQNYHKDIWYNKYKIIIPLASSKIEKYMKLAAKWQAERLYSEEEVRIMLSESFKASQEGYNITADEIIEQFKKKQDE